MAGTPLGGRKARDTNKNRYGDNFYPSIGRKGGKISRGGIFAKDPAFAREMGRRGGSVSKRGKNVPSD